MQQSRRSFVQLASAVAVSAGAPSLLGEFPANKHIPLGVQLYTVRNELKDNLPGTLAAIKKIGYDMVEPYSGMYTRPAKELRAVIADAGLAVLSAHFTYDTLESMQEYAHDLGVRYMVCAMIPKPAQNRSGFLQAAAEFNKVGTSTKAMNIKLCFHNHNFEFKPQPATPGKETSSTDETGLALLLNHTDPALVSWEEDCYWVAQSGNDPLALLRKYKNRVDMLHLKDRKPDATNTFEPGKQSQFFTEIGTGTIDWAPIVKIAESSGKLMFVEQDTTTTPALESLAISYKNLRKYVA
ncbi:MAG: sugar phosphate isomerase/epimerase [Bryocella sp.]